MAEQVKPKVSASAKRAPTTRKATAKVTVGTSVSTEQTQATATTARGKSKGRDVQIGVTSPVVTGASTASAQSRNNLSVDTVAEVAAARVQEPEAKSTMPQVTKGDVTQPLKTISRSAATATSELVAHSMDMAAAPDQDLLRVFQIHYLPEQTTTLDPGFIPYNNSGDSSPLLEYNVFRKLAGTDMVKGASLWGAVSWKFGSKTGLDGAEFRRLISANPGFDVYFCNPHPETEALYHNLWVQGEPSHPDFLALCTAFFHAAGLPTSQLSELQPSSSFSTANFLVGTPAFWQRYLAFIDGVLARADRNLPEPIRHRLYSPEADAKGVHAGASYIPFIIERLFSTFLMGEGHSLRACKLPSRETTGPANVHVRLLREMKDAAHRSNSLWLAACWVNYRNLYFAQTHGRSWLTRYLRKITPLEIRFAAALSESFVIAQN